MYVPTSGLIWVAVAHLALLCDCVAGRFARRKTNGMPGEYEIGSLDEDANRWINPIDSVLASEDTPVYTAQSDPGSPAGVRITQRHGIMEMTSRWLRNPRHLPFISLGRESDVGAKHGWSSPSGRSASSESTLGQTYEGIALTIYPKVLVVVEHSLYEKSGRDVYRVLKHVLTMMNGVDLKYRSLERPRVRFHIVGIVVATDPGATPYIARSMVNVETFDTFRAMTAAKRFFYDIKDSIAPKSYDMALTLTRLFFGEGYLKKILGQSWPRTVCTDNDETDSRMMNALSIVRENDAFESIHYAAHELAHVLGIDHDPDEPADCEHRNGFLMSSALIFTKNSSSFSECSLRQFEENLRNGKFDCMFEKPRIREGAKLPNLMPGRVSSLSEQCTASERGPACLLPDSDVCMKLMCYDDEEQCIEISQPALDGSQCNDGNEIRERYCVLQKCVNV